MALSAAIGGLAAAIPNARAFAKHAGGLSGEGLARIPAALQAYVDNGSAIGLVTLLYRRGFRARSPAAQPAIPRVPGSTVFNNLAYAALAQAR